MYPRGGRYGKGTQLASDGLGGKVMSLEEGSESRNGNCQRENLIFVIFHYCNLGGTSYKKCNFSASKWESLPSS